MSLLLDILTKYPNCRVTIRSGGAPRKKPYEGQLKVLKRKGRLIRVQQIAYAGPRGTRPIGYCVRNGRPVWEWVSESTLSALDIKRYADKRAERGDPV